MWSQIGQTSCQEKPGRIVLKSQWGWSWFQRVWILKCPLSTSMLPYQQIVPNDNWLMNSLVNFYFSMWAELTEGCPLLVTVVKSGVSGAEAGWLELTGWRTHKSRLVLTVATPPPHQQLQRAPNLGLEAVLSSALTIPLIKRKIFGRRTGGRSSLSRM